MIETRSMQMEESVAGVSTEADEQRDKRAARPLGAAGESVGFERRLRLRAKTSGCAGATPQDFALVGQRSSKAIVSDMVFRAAP